MSCEESHHPPPQAVVSFRTGGHPTGAEMVLGGFLMILGLALFYTWVATFDAIWSLGIFPFAFGAILVFHADPILETLQKWRTPSKGPAPSKSH
ncbi:MAG: hypothetical protein KGJ23_11790 [Euryarchaeota archaeon]|nr:hypothetical protein [Euryarchaeota archaeon]MDE1837277.1 hypothetical protein [Euryarchaeota archaeon]MDE1879947.1 hypothetical protein [Euryarchaeota archaeon]MDE2045119.1 hypothetical protein [Thermoplasmata archaeon]